MDVTYTPRGPTETYDALADALLEGIVPNQEGAVWQPNQNTQTNIGPIPNAEYRDIAAQQSGFDSYEDMYNQGYRLGKGRDADLALQQAIDATLGVQQNQQNSVDVASNTGYNNSSATGRSVQVQDAMDRLNRGGKDTPTIDEIMSIPEIAAAEQANAGPETYTLPNRESIRQKGYEAAMQKGSWDGQDYTGPVRQDRRMDIVIGLPGSGKSSVYTERLSQEYQSRVIDTDDFREYIPEYNGSNAAAVHEEASQIKAAVFDDAIENGDNILLSTIGANAEKLKAQIQGYANEGYSVYLHLNELPNSKALARAIGRYISEDGSTGRYVSPALIAEYGDKPTQTYLELTGQGGTNNDKNLDGNLRIGRGQYSENVGGAEAASQTEGGLLSGYDWYNNDVERGQAPRLIQASEQIAQQAQSSSSLPMSEQTGDVNQSKVYTNSGLKNRNETIRSLNEQQLKANPEVANYNTQTHADTTKAAQARIDQNSYTSEYNRLLNAEQWDSADNVESQLVLDQLFKDGDAERHVEMEAAMKAKETSQLQEAGRLIESQKTKMTMQDAKTPQTACSAATTRIDALDESTSTWKQTDGGKEFAAWKKNKKGGIIRLAAFPHWGNLLLFCNLYADQPARTSPAELDFGQAAVPESAQKYSFVKRYFPAFFFGNAMLLPAEVPPRCSRAHRSRFLPSPEAYSFRRFPNLYPPAAP